MTSSKMVLLEDVAVYSKDKVEVEKITEANYISTENLLPNYGGKMVSSGLPNMKKVSEYINNDILVSNIRPYFKKIWRATCKGGASNDILVIKPKAEIIPEFLYYNLANDQFFDYVMSGAKGTKMPRGDKKHIMGYEFKVPSLEMQRSIANVLSTLDEKIEINNQINKILENMAQSIFKQWFVDFEFPNEDGEPYKSSGGKMIESELGMIPGGWGVVEVSNLCEVCSSKRIFARDYVESGIPFYRGKEIIEKSKGNKISNELFISEGKYQDIKVKYPIPEEGDMLLTSVGTLGVPYLVENEEFYFKDGNLTWFRNFEEAGYRNYIYLWIRSELGKKEIDAITIGSTQKALTITVLKKMKVLKFTDEVLEQFSTISNSIVKQIQINNRENLSLISLRDILLPKLMSGEIRVPLDTDREIS